MAEPYTRAAMVSVPAELVEALRALADEMEDPNAERGTMPGVRMHVRRVWAARLRTVLGAFAAPAPLSPSVRRTRDEGSEDEAEAAEAVRNGWIYGREAACRFIARTAWPWEAESNRDSWAPRIGNEPEFGRKELALAHRRLDQAAGTLGLRAARLAGKDDRP